MKHFAMYFLASLHFRLLTGGYDDDDADGGGLSVGSQYPSSSSFFPVHTTYSFSSRNAPSIHSPSSLDIALNAGICCLRASLRELGSSG